MISSTILKRYIQRNLNFIRFKHKKNHWSVQKKQKTSSMKALEHFDEFYEQVFTTKWPYIRKALLGNQKYVAVVNNYSDNEEICASLEARGAINMREIFFAQKKYLKEQQNAEKRQAQLESIREAAERDEDVEKPEITRKIDLSLEASLANAQYDHSRLIDGNSPNALGNMHEFVPATQMKGREDFIPESKYYDFAKPAQRMKIEIVPEYNLHFPEALQVYSYEESNWTEFPQPSKGTTHVLDYYLMDGASLLPVLALDLRPGVNLFDMCSAPGGKSLLAIQTLYPHFVVCNDESMSRTKRIENVMRQYLYNFKENWLDTNKILITCEDARGIKGHKYDRVLVDVPCTTDRHSVAEDDNNIFRTDRIKERLKLPELQCELLTTALKLVKVGGVVVYSTCTLSPIQNDGVVHMALKHMWEETNLEFIVKDLNPALQQIQTMYHFANPSLVNYGTLVLPISQQNFGPTYFAKIERTK